MRLDALRLTGLAIPLLAAAAHAEVSPRVIKTLFPTADVVIASVVVEAARDGSVDATAAIQAAIDEAAVAGGAVVSLPAGRYLVAGRLVVKEGVTLRGDWCPPSEGRTPETTILMLTAGRGEADGPATITTERGSGLRELTMWYPEQDPASIVPYPWTIRTSESATGDNTTIYNATLVNPYQAVRIGPEWNELHTLRNVYATALRCGVSIDTTTDIGRLIDVDFGPEWWETSGLFGAPTTDEARQALRSALLTDAVAVDMGRSDWEDVYGLRVRGYGVGMKVRPGAQGTTNGVLYACSLEDCSTGLVLERLNGIGLSLTGCVLTAAEHAVLGPESFDTVAQFNTCRLSAREGSAVRLEGRGTLSFQGCVIESPAAAAIEATRGQLTALGCDFTSGTVGIHLGPGVARARVLGNAFAGEPVLDETSGADVQVSHRAMDSSTPAIPVHPSPPDPRPATGQLFCVTDFGADPAAEDNAAAFTAALNKAAESGGGTVYVPAGNYRFSSGITVPTGVELRGTFDVPHHTVSGGATLMPLCGKGSEEGTPFITLQERSGLRGLGVWYPEQNPSEPVAYPWTIRSGGPGCWLVDVNLGNSYQGADFWQNPSSGHVIRYLSGAMFKRGLFVSKSDGPGCVEDVQFNPHYCLRLHPSLPHPEFRGDAGGDLIRYQRANLEGMVFGRCRKEDVRRTFLYAAYDGIAFRDDAGGANAVIVNHGTDTGSRCAVLEAAGPEGLVFLNAQLVPLGEHEKGAIIVDPRFFGKASFYNSQMWAGNVTAIVEGSGDVLLQQLNTLSGPVTLEGGRCTLENVLFARDLDPAITVAEGCASARVVAGVTPGVLRVQNGAGERCTCVGGSLSRQPAPGTSGFSTGFEPDDPQPTEDTIATSGGGIRSVSSPSCKVVEGLGRDGGRALRVYGVADDPEYSYAYFTVFAEPLVVHSGSKLSYWLKPENERGQCVGIDVLFADGQVMRDAGVQDSEGRGTHPGGQRGTIGQWTQVTIPIGRYRANAEIKAILFAYDSRGGGGPFEALVDDVLLDPGDGGTPWQVSAEPNGGTYPAPLTVHLASDAPAIRYTLDGTPPTALSPVYEDAVELTKPGLYDLRYVAQGEDGAMSKVVLGQLYEVR